MWCIPAQRTRDRSVCRCAWQAPADDGDEDAVRLLSTDHVTTIPYTMTNIIGSNEANAINPKPSIIGLRPLIAEAKPTPNAVTNGTVIVDVVTPF